MEGESRRRQEFTRHLERHQSRLFGYLHSLVRDLDDAEDLFQETSLIIWKKFDEYDARRSFFSWACGIARLEVANFLRARGRSRLYFSDQLNLLLLEAHEKLASGSSQDDAEARREALNGCVAKLRQRDRRLLEECYGSSARIAEIAEQLARSAQSVHNSLRRIRRALHECIHRTLAAEGSP